jgi:hypothetical protein
MEYLFFIAENILIGEYQYIIAIRPLCHTLEMVFAKIYFTDQAVFYIDGLEIRRVRLSIRKLGWNVTIYNSPIGIRWIWNVAPRFRRSLVIEISRYD